MEALEIANDDFIRTEPRHKASVSDCASAARPGDIELDLYRARLSAAGAVRSDDGFARRPVPDPHLPVAGSRRRILLRLSRFQTPARLVRAHWRDRRSSLQRGTRCIRPACATSRSPDRLTWGTRCLGSRHVTYVWFDALTNYLSSVGLVRAERFDRGGGRLPPHRQGSSSALRLWPRVLWRSRASERSGRRRWLLSGLEKMSKTPGTS